MTEECGTGKRICVVVSNPRFVPEEESRSGEVPGGAAPYPKSSMRSACAQNMQAINDKNAKMARASVDQQRYSDCLERKTVEAIKGGGIELGLETAACVAVAIKADKVCLPLVLVPPPALELCAASLPWAVGTACTGNAFQKSRLKFLKAREEARKACEEEASNPAEECTL